MMGDPYLLGRVGFLHNLPYPRPVDVEHSANFSITHALLEHGKDVSPKLDFVRVTQIAFG
jgi:hypothetical protein